METKVCKRCGRELPTTEFYANNRAKDGLGTYCKECSNSISVEYARKRIEFEKKYKIHTNKELAKFSPRELMLELYRRGYEGELVYVEKKTTTINLKRLFNDN